MPSPPSDQSISSRYSTQEDPQGIPWAIVLLSGGLDSATSAAIARDQGFRLHALSVDYGQRHRFELQAAERVKRHLNVESSSVVEVALGSFGGSALTDEIEVPHHRDADEMAAEIPVTYVPARNTVFLSLALACAEALGAADIFIGVNAVDYSGYPDCRPEFIAKFQELAQLATKVGVEGAAQIRIHTPLIEMTKADIVRTGTQLGVDYSLTHTCYDPSEAGLSCGVCDACILRRRGFEDAGLVDPLPYQR